jgi:hypothetical protein
MSVALFALITVLAQPASVRVEFWNDMADDVTVSAPGGAPATVTHYKDGGFTAPGDAKSLTVHVKGCDYVLTFPGALKDFLDPGDGAVRLYLSDATKLYIVPPDLILQTPPDFLDPRQPNQFPLDPAKQACKAA